MKTILGLSIFLCAILIFFSGCVKEYSYEGGTSTGISTGTAVFTYTGGNATCTGAVIKGNFQAAVVTNTSNTVQLQVSVTKIGTYNISTSSINGIVFSAHGTFTITGLQTITFVGTGTPAVKGSFTYFTPNRGCSFLITVTATGTASKAVYTFSGAPNACNPVVINGTYTMGVAATSTNTVNVQVDVTTIGSFDISTNTLNEISFSANGNFTMLGSQMVTLTGKGKPVTAGPFNYAPVNNGCSFTINFSSPAPPATFTIQSNGVNCTAPVINGTYAGKQPLTMSNTIELTANVTVAGSYNFTTNTANDMNFSASGVFTATGIQKLILIGSGTPAAGGTFVFTPQFTGACSFEVTVAEAPPLSGGIITCKIDGVFTAFNIEAFASISKDEFGLGIKNLSIVGKSISGSSTFKSFEIYISKKVESQFPLTTYDENTYFKSSLVYAPGLIAKPVNLDEENWITFYKSPFTPDALPFSIRLTNITASKVIGTFRGSVIENNGRGPVNKLITEGIFNVPFQ